MARTEPVASFDPADLTAFIQANDIERVMVTTPDYTHADYIVEGLEAGADVVVEKPLTIDAEGCRRITKAVAKRAGTWWSRSTTATRRATAP